MRIKMRSGLVFLAVVVIKGGAGAALVLSHDAPGGASRGLATPPSLRLPTPTRLPHLPPSFCADWAVVPVAPEAGESNLNAATALAADDFWAVGVASDSSGVAIHWDGSTWKQYPTPKVAGRAGLSAVAAASSTDVWAVGLIATSQQTSRTLIEHWNGSRWSVVSSPNPTNEQSMLYGVAVLARNDVWAVGTTGLTNTQPVMLHWNGTSWRDVSGPFAPYASELNSVAGVASNDVWAVGSSGGSGPQTLAEHWNGRDWQIVSVPRGPTVTGSLNSVVARAANDVWVVGYGVSSPNSGISLTEHWNSTDWHVVRSPSPVANGINALIAVTAVPGTNNLWAIGAANGESAVGQTSSQPLIEEWSGKAWIVVHGPSSAASDLTSVATTPQGDEWALGGGLAMVHAGAAMRSELNCPLA